MSCTELQTVNTKSDCFFQVCTDCQMLKIENVRSNVIHTHYKLTCSSLFCLGQINKKCFSGNGLKFLGRVGMQFFKKFFFGGGGI